jgi:hypothetical protein
MTLNYVYAASLGFGGYSLGGLRADVFTLPLSHSITLPAGDVLGDREWKLRLLLPIQLGIYRLNVTDTDGTRISVTQQSLGAIPAVELQIPFGQRTVLKPFVGMQPLDMFLSSRPRIGLGYIFGGGLQVWRVAFGFPF